MSQGEQPIRCQNISCIVPASDEEGGIFLGNYYGAQDHRILKEYGIRAVLTFLIDKKVEYNPEDIPFHMYINAPDSENYDITSHFEDSIQFIDHARKFTNVYVHCHAGVSRSAAVVCAYLMKKYGWNLQQTLEFVIAKRVVVKPNPGFMEKLQLYQMRLQKINTLSTQSSNRNHSPALRRNSNLAPQQLVKLPSHELGQMENNNTSIYPTLTSPRMPLTSQDFYKTGMNTFSQTQQALMHHYNPPVVAAYDLQSRYVPQMTNTSMGTENMTYAKPHTKHQIKKPKIFKHNTPLPKMDNSSHSPAKIDAQRNSLSGHRIDLNQRSHMLHQQDNRSVKNLVSLQKKTNHDMKEKNKTVSRCIIRPKDLPGYAYY